VGELQVIILNNSSLNARIEGDSGRQVGGKQKEFMALIEYFSFEECIIFGALAQAQARWELNVSLFIRDKERERDKEQEHDKERVCKRELVDKVLVYKEQELGGKRERVCGRQEQVCRQVWEQHKEREQVCTRVWEHDKEQERVWEHDKGQPHPRNSHQQYIRVRDQR
jgi:hypothetical protein